MGGSEERADDSPLSFLDVDAAKEVDGRLPRFLPRRITLRFLPLEIQPLPEQTHNGLTNLR